MTRSLRSASPTRRRPLGGWRGALLVSTLSAVLVVSPLTLQAVADDQVPDEPTSTTSGEEPQPGEATPTDTPSEPAQDVPSDEPSDEPTEPSTEPTPTEEPSASETSPSETVEDAEQEAPKDTKHNGDLAVSGSGQSLYATGGTGTYQGAIDWFQWGNHGDAIPAAGLTRTNTRTVAGATLATTCTIGSVVGSIRAYRPGSWGGDGLDNMYNVGGVGTSNQLIVGIANVVDGATPTFNFSCSLTLDGTPVAVAGLVMADAEQSGANEYVQATIPSGDWRLIDRIRAPGTCSSDTAVNRTGQTLRMTGPLTPCATGPDGVAFMEGATSANVELKGGGVSAIALGVMLFNDFGDAPASYGDAAALYDPNFAGGTVPAGNSTLFGATLSTPTPPNSRLGATVDSEASQQVSAGATGDGTDEDAIAALGTANVVPGATYTVPSVACTGPGDVAGWIDWNRNGSFGAGERSATATCSGSSVSLSWTVPADVRSGASFLRLRIGPNAASVAGPTGVTTAGEVEDHPLALLAPADLGDAPASYGTTMAGNGPRHDVPFYDEGAHTAPLMLGASIDTDSDGVPGAAANGDDTAGVDDEGALPALAIAPGATTASATVPVVNTTGGAATLYGWIDANNNGAFQSGEAATVTVPNGATSATLSWSGLPAAVDGTQPVVRLRLTSATLVDSAGTAALDERSQGAAPDGEVEDSLAAAATELSDSCTEPFVQDFGTGTGYGPPLPSGQTTYLYEGSGAVNDGEYGVVSALPGVAGGWWHTGQDHTPGDTDGRLMLINAAYAPGLFFSRTFTGLEVGSAYDFSAWITNANSAGSPILPDVAFRVVNPANGAILATVSTGDITNKASLVWSRYNLSFTAPLATVRFDLVNDAPGGNGNDLAIDDIAVAKACEHGDAPDSYGTLITSGGAVHGTGSGLRLGASIDYEGDGQPTPGADGDDTAGDDEDGVAPITVTQGSTPSVDVNVTNTGNTPATLAGWVDLDASGTFEANERAVATVAPLTTGGTVTLTFSGPVTTTQATYARFRLFPGTPADPLPTGAATAGEVEDYPVTTLVPSLTVAKTSDATASSKPGDVLTYTVTVTNTGTGAYTALNPARLVDDLTGVLDDATYQNDAAATVDGGAVSVPTYVAPRVLWSGPLAAGKSVVVTYTVVLKGGGDGHVRNTAFAPPGNDPTPPTPDCSTPGPVPCDTELFELPKLSITKIADRTELPAVGQTITYEVTVTNTGLGAFTAAHPATFSDDLSDVLDDTQPLTPADITATSGTATFSDPTLSWTGTLPAGDSATIAYTLTYTGAGDQELVNDACVPASEAKDPNDLCRTVLTPGSGLHHSKSVDPATGTPVDVGQVLTYTLTFENVGPAAATVDTFDDLSDVADDAVLDNASITADAGLTATPNGAGDRIDITGSVPTGETLTVTYQVQVKAFADQGDHVLTNALACEPGDPTPCAPETTSNPVAHLVIDKTSDRTADSAPGDTITYTVTATNDGPGDFTVFDQATVVDDLTGVLDDATYQDDAAASVGGSAVSAPTYDAPRITWSGSLASGDTVTISYTVVLKGGGDGQVLNVAWQPADPGNPGPTPDCATSPLPCDTESFDLPKLTVAKSADRADLPATGQTVTYTVVVTNQGPGDYTAAHPATFSDDLSDVLDDATEGPISATVGSASITGTTLSWSGVLAAGQAATITYTVTYRATGDRVLDNTACVPAAEAQVPAENCDTVSVPGSGLVHAKSVSPASGTPVEVGDVLTYTLTFDNTTGQTPATVDTEDDLSDVVDDATLDTASVTAGAGLTATPTPAGTPTAIAVTGSVPAGAVRTVTYQVTVNPFAQQGDHLVTNALACEPGEPTPCAPETTTNPVRHVVLTKAMTSPTAPNTGDVVTYTLTVVNDGAGDWTAGDPVSVEDDLTGVLDDATWDDTASASDGTVSFADPELTWTGALAAGDTVTVTYTVTVTNQGDHRLVNTASVTGCQLPGCTPAPVDTPLPHVVPSKTSAPATGQALQPGDLVTYTLSWTNDGEAPGVVDGTDDLSGVLDDAVVVTEPTSSDPAVTATRTGTTLRVVGPIADGDTVTVTYQVRVKPAGQHGDNSMDNVLTPDTPQVTCPPFPCTPVSPPGTHHSVGDLDDWKTVDPATGTPVKAGRRLTYTLHFASTGTAPVTVDRVDDLSGVLDDAALVGTPVSSNPALTVTGPTAGRIAVTGSLPAGTQATVTYTVQVKHDGQRGDDRLGNFLLAPGQQPPASCDTGAHVDCTVNPVVPLEFDLALDKKLVSASTVEAGDTVRYKLRVTNRGPDTAPAPIVIRDPLPAGLDLVAAHGHGWDCKVKKAVDVVVCHRDKDLAAGEKAPALIVVAKVAAGASGRIVNKAKVKANGDTRPSNNNDSAPLQVATPDLPHTGFRIGASEFLRFRW